MSSPTHEYISLNPFLNLQTHEQLPSGHLSINIPEALQTHKSRVKQPSHQPGCSWQIESPTTQLSNIGTQHRNELDSCKAHDCENSEKSFKSNLNPIKTIVQKTVYVYPILLISYLIVFIVTIIVLLVIFVKDDSCLKLAKLDELHEVKNIIENGNFNDSIDKTTETTHCPITKTNPTIYEKTKSNKADLLKHYMSCVTEL